MSLTTGQIQTALDAHGVPHFVNSKDVVMAFESATRKLADGTIVDASEWIPAPVTRSAMLAWLGY